MGGYGGYGLVGGVGVEGAVESLALCGVGGGELDEVLPVGDSAERSVIPGAFVFGITYKRSLWTATTGGIICVVVVRAAVGWGFSSKSHIDSREIGVWSVRVNINTRTPEIAVGCPANPKLALDGDCGVEDGFVDVAVIVAVATVGKHLQTKHFGLVGVPPGVGHGEKPAAGVERDGVHLDFGIADIQVEIFRQLCAVEYCDMVVYTMAFSILGHQSPEPPNS